jgi:DNA-binding transcriptional MerR regulator
MNQYYSIGQTAKLFNISVQTLRFYEKMGLIEPARVNEETGYRYYVQEQFHRIDRIHYLKSLGLQLKEIKNIMDAGQVDKLQHFLRKNLASRLRDLNNLNEQISDLEWYMEYFNYMDNVNSNSPFRIAFLKERYILKAPCSPDEPFADIELHLTKLRSLDGFKVLQYRRHYGFMIDFNLMIRQRFSPTAAYIFLKRRPEMDSPYIDTLPEGKYLCFTAQLRLNRWNSQEVKDFLEKCEYTPAFAVANEYEDNLTEYTATPYEVQIYLKPKG